ncbi:uncharacterized protein DEA37_0011370 [Paragonimus westermani]|uniref:Uncharacterized protein n=1 Tax=Paragonimus westermani TaxID=34504 RepID=A0A5J4NB78_9TREM|nr:uncharacterized protein DEA37_0011370 [Paragonimus westermani]
MKAVLFLLVSLVSLVVAVPEIDMPCKSAVRKGIKFLSDQVQKMDPEETCKEPVCNDDAEKHEINTDIAHISLPQQLIIMAMCAELHAEIS